MKESACFGEFWIFSACLKIDLLNCKIEQEGEA